MAVLRTISYVWLSWCKVWWRKLSLLAFSKECGCFFATGLTGRLNDRWEKEQSSALLDSHHSAQAPTDSKTLDQVGKVLGSFRKSVIKGESQTRLQNLQTSSKAELGYNKRSKKFLPFSDGSRSCIGQVRKFLLSKWFVPSLWSNDWISWYKLLSLLAKLKSISVNVYTTKSTTMPDKSKQAQYSTIHISCRVATSSGLLTICWKSALFFLRYPRHSRGHAGTCHTGIEGCSGATYRRVSFPSQWRHGIATNAASLRDYGFDFAHCRGYKMPTAIQECRNCLEDVFKWDTCYAL